MRRPKIRGGLMLFFDVSVKLYNVVLLFVNLSDFLY